MFSWSNVWVDILVVTEVVIGRGWKPHSYDYTAQPGSYLMRILLV